MVSTTSQLDLYSLKQTVQVLRVGVQVKDREGLHTLAKLEDMIDDRIIDRSKFRRKKTIKEAADELKELDDEIQRLKRKE